MGDPWKSGDNPLSDSGNPTNLASFDDHFCPELPADTTPSVSTQRPFKPLDDSESYLANLERKLSKLRTKSTVSSSAEKQDLLYSLSGVREGHLDRFLNSETTLGALELTESDTDIPVDDSLKSSVIRHIAPHLQALTAGELVHLLKADELSERTSAEDKSDSEVITSDTQPSSN